MIACHLNVKELYIAQNICVSYSHSRVFYRPELNVQNRVLYKVCGGL